MKSLSATAALLLFAGAVALVVTAMHPSTPAFADVVEQLRSAHTLSYTKLIAVKDNPKMIKTQEFIAEDGRRRSEHQGGTTTIFDASRRIRLTLIEGSKTAIVPAPREKRPEISDRTATDWLDRFKKMGDMPDKELGEKSINGHRAVGFVATQARVTYTIWVDADTSEIVRVEHNSRIEGPVDRIVMTDFRFNEPLDEALFSFDVPAGYTIMQQPAIPKLIGGEASIIEALKGYTKRADGKFPDSITDWGAWAVLLSAGSNDGVLSEEITRIMGRLGSIVPFLSAMAKADYEYVGKGKTTADTNTIVFWYKTKKGTHRAIFTDLTVKDIAAENVPK